MLLFLCLIKKQAEARQQDKLNVQKEMRAIRAAEIEKKRNEDEEKERRESRFNRSADSPSNSLNNSASIKVSSFQSSVRSYYALSFIKIIDKILINKPTSNEKLRVIQVIYIFL